MTPVEVVSQIDWVASIPMLGAAIILSFWLWGIHRADDERRRWRPVFRAGVYEYQQHEDGRRRAVRIVPGESDLDTVWLIDGKAVDL